MVLSEGLFCPEVDQHCAVPAGEPAAELCQRYAKPSVCLSLERELMRFCIDRFEWPNRLGQKPLVLVSWEEAQQLCASAGKRLCDEDEWVFACEGEQLLPYTYGYERDPTRCVIDRLPSNGPEPQLPHDRCMDDSECKSAFDALDQREPAGTFQQCVSPSGAHDMNGNVEEWVRLQDSAGLAGGFWGPERANCRVPADSTTRNQRGYQVGFRCCRNAAP
jgi:formylglycine-generating enzyme required for sulfatase activity